MSAYGYADGQSITGWLGVPLVTATGLALGAGTHVDGPFSLTNFASVIVAIKATGGPVAVKVQQSISGGPAAVVLEEDLVVTAGETVFQAFVLFGDSVTVELDGSVGGTTVDYAVYPSNTTTNAQVIQSATINVQHNGALVGTEQGIDFEDGGGVAFSVTDDGANQRVKIAAAVSGAILAEAEIVAPVALANVTEPNATVIATAPAVVFDGVTPCYVEFNAPELEDVAGSTVAHLYLFDKLGAGAAASIGEIGTHHGPADPNGHPLAVRSHKITPAAGSHVFSLRGTSNFNDGTVQCGAGGAGALLPASIRVIRG